jgi:hypothetical protein
MPAFLCGGTGWVYEVTMLQRVIFSAIASAALSLGAIFGFSVLSGAVFTHDRAQSVVLHALATNSLLWNDRRDEDLFTECAMLQMQLLRPKDAWTAALDTRFLMRDSDHPCATLVRTVMRIDLESMPPARSYFNYPYGPRHIEAAVLSLIRYPAAVNLYYALSYGSLALLLGVMLWRDREFGILLSPLPIVLSLGFSLHLFGGNLAHAPGYILGWLELAAFVAALPWLRAFPRRVAVFIAIGFLAAYTDLLAGVTPTLLALTIVLNHFFYVHRRPERYLQRTAVNALAICACFVLASLLLNGSRLALLAAQGVTADGHSLFGTFWSNLMSKSATDIGLSAPLTIPVVLDRLWEARRQLTYGDELFATVLLGIGALSWLVATILSAFATRTVQADILILGAASLGIFLWFATLPAHTHVHALFMVRLLALPCAFGACAVMLLLAGNKRFVWPADRAAA